MDCNEALKAAQLGRVGDVKDLDELRSGLSALHLQYGSYRDPGIKAAIESFENEVSRRNQQESASNLHQSAMAQGEKLHVETMSELGKLKKSVDQLAYARCIDKWILVAGWIAAVAGVAAVVLALKH